MHLHTSIAETPREMENMGTGTGTATGTGTRDGHQKVAVGEKVTVVIFYGAGYISVKVMVRSEVWMNVDRLDTCGES